MALEKQAEKSFKVCIQASNAPASSVFTNSKWEVQASGALFVYEGGDEPKTTVFGPSVWLRVEDPAPKEMPRTAPQRIR